jgi:ABC-type multidrug transport system ATPase subunit
LSTGERRRLSLAVALAANSRLLLDEPTANLDPEGMRLVRDAIAQFRKKAS